MMPARDPSSLYLFGGTVILFFMGYAAWAIRSGSFHIQNRTDPIRRVEEPRSFWVAVTLCGVVAPLAIFIAVIWELNR